MSRPNPSELAVLKHLWREGPQSASEVHKSIGPDQDWKPSTTRTIIARMEEKGWVTRADVHGMTVFTAVLDRTQTLGALVRQFARQVLDMDGPLPASFFAESPHLSDAELDELDAIINAADNTEDKA